MTMVLEMISQGQHPGWLKDYYKTPTPLHRKYLFKHKVENKNKLIQFSHLEQEIL